jgi:hypothetical protein
MFSSPIEITRNHKKHGFGHTHSSARISEKWHSSSALNPYAGTWYETTLTMLENRFKFLCFVIVTWFSKIMGESDEQTKTIRSNFLAQRSNFSNKTKTRRRKHGSSVAPGDAILLRQQHRRQYQIHKNHSNYTSNFSAAQPVEYSLNGTYLFLAGLGGTGHHYYQHALRHCPYCADVPQLRYLLYYWWFKVESGDQNSFDYKMKDIYSQIRKQLLTPRPTNSVSCLNTYVSRATGMLSYPNQAHRTRYPQIDKLASLMVNFDAKLIVVVLLRNTLGIYHSIVNRFNNSFVESWGDADEKYPVAAALTNQAKVLKLQLQGLSRSQYACIQYENTRATSYVIDRLLFQNQALSTSWSFQNHALKKFTLSKNVNVSISSRDVFLEPFHRANSELIHYCLTTSS